MTHDYVLGDVVSEGNQLYIALSDNTGILPSSNILIWKHDNSTQVNSINSGAEKRIPDMVEMTKADFDAIGAGRPQKLYIILG